MSIRKKFLVCILGWLISFIIYIILLVCFSFLDNVLFFRACLISVIAGIFSVIIWLKFKGDHFEAILNYITCVLLLILFTIIGPTFIDRSVSYHMIFYAVDNGSINVSDMKDIYLDDMFQKRINDELKSGMIYKEDDNTYKPTLKAKLATYILKPIGTITNTTKEYDTFYKKIKNKNLKDNEHK